MDKPVQRTGKRNAGAEAPVKSAAGGRGGKDQVFTRADAGKWFSLRDGMERQGDRRAGSGGGGAVWTVETGTGRRLQGIC